MSLTHLLRVMAQFVACVLLVVIVGVLGMKALTTRPRQQLPAGNLPATTPVYQPARPTGGYSCEEMVEGLISAEEDRLGRELTGYEVYMIRNSVEAANTNAGKAPC